jgi:hypothetical protein
VVDLRAAVAHHTADAVEELAFIVDLAGAGEVDLAMVVAAVLQLDLVGAGLRAAADHVQQAAGRGLAIDRGSRAAQQGQAVEVPGFGFGLAYTPRAAAGHRGTGSARSRAPHPVMRVSLP